MGKTVMTKSKTTEKAFQKPGFVGNFRLQVQDEIPRPNIGTATYFHRETFSGNRQSKDFCGLCPSMRPLSFGSCGLPTISHDGAVLPYYGADGIMEGIPNCSMSSGVAPEVRSVRRTLRGSSSFNLAVRMTVVIRDTFFFPCSDLVPKVSLLKMTEFLKPCSARLFVGSIISGYLRNVKISCLCVISRLRIVSASLWDSGFEYSFLNRLNMSFLPERHCSAVNPGYCL